MSSAPDPGWAPPPAAGPAGPGASLKWRILQSWWLLLPVLGFSCLGGFGFLYVGLRARRPAWWIPGIVYTVVGWTAFITVGETDQESAISDWAVGAMLAIWAGSILHAALINPAWLRWRARYRPWYAQQAAATPWPGGAYPPGPLAPPPGGPAHPAAPTSGPYPPGSPAYPPAYPAYPTSPAFPPTSPVFAPTSPPPDPTMVAQPPGDYFASGPVAAPMSGRSAAPAGPVDVNTARLDEFAALPGFDPQRAQQVLGERDRRGGFGSLAEFAAVANLAPHEYARVRDILVCAPPTLPGHGQPPHGRVLDV